MDIIFRNETKDDHRQVEDIIRNSFWNLNFPGCDEHYLAHIMREHEDFIPQLDIIAVLGGSIVGSIMYTRSWLTDEKGGETQILTFGPVCVAPEFQRRGIGRRLMEFSFDKAVSMGYGGIVIFGSPANYVPLGFKSSVRYNICTGDGKFPTAMLAKELKEGFFDSLGDGKKFYRESSLFDIDPKKAEEFDKLFEPKEKLTLPCQEEFFIYSNSKIMR